MLNMLPMTLPAHFAPYAPFMAPMGPAMTNGKSPTESYFPPFSCSMMQARLYSHKTNRSGLKGLHRSGTPLPSSPANRTPVSTHMTSQSVFPTAVPLLRSSPTCRSNSGEFTLDDLNLALYGYVKGGGKEHQEHMNRKEMAGLAISGLRLGELSYGIDRILGSQSPKMSHMSASQIEPTVLDLPSELELKQTTFSGLIHYGVFSRKSTIPRGTRYGPFQGKIVNTSEIKTNDDNSFMWEIFKDGKLSHFIDGRGASGNWMCHVNCARYAHEQNIISIQIDGEIYYELCKDIFEGNELLVWYGDSYLQFMGIPSSLKGTVAGGVIPRECDSSEGFTCERCGKVFAYKYYRDKHLKYTKCVDHGNRKFPCTLCTRSFEKRDRLRIHILHVHEKHRPHKCHVCSKSFSQSSSLNKHMRVHSGERPYKCVYCSKAFTASSILRTHIRQHSGEKPFKCRHCGKAFASHAAHDSHVRRTHAKDKIHNVLVKETVIEDTIDVVGYDHPI